MMMLMRTLFLLMIAQYAQAGSNSEFIEHRVWNKNPIKIVLPVGQERRIDFPVKVEFGLPERLTKISRIQSSESGSVYWLAGEVFDTTRVIVTTLDKQFSWYLDIEARQGAATHPVSIVDDRIESVRKPGEKKIASPRYNYDYADITQFASQFLYAPQRLIKTPKGVQSVAIKNRCNLPLYRGGDLLFEPIIQWRSPTKPTFYVTAVRVTSNHLDVIAFDPRLIRGDWLAATAQHAVIYPPGSGADTTAVYLVSSAPFDEVAPLTEGACL